MCVRKPPTVPKRILHSVACTPDWYFERSGFSVVLLFVWCRAVSNNSSNKHPKSTKNIPVCTKTH